MYINVPRSGILSHIANIAPIKMVLLKNSVKVLLKNWEKDQQISFFRMIFTGKILQHHWYRQYNTLCCCRQIQTRTRLRLTTRLNMQDLKNKDTENLYKISNILSIPNGCNVRKLVTTQVGLNCSYKKESFTLVETCSEK